MNTKDLLTLIIAFLGFILGLINLCINIKKEKREKEKEKREKEKAEKDKLNKSIESDMLILKNALYNYQNFVNTFIAMLQEGQKNCTQPITLYENSRLIHLATTNHQDYKFEYMKKQLKNKDADEIKKLLEEIEKIRQSLINERHLFKSKPDILIEDIEKFQLIQQRIDVLTNQYIPKF